MLGEIGMALLVNCLIIPLAVKDTPVPKILLKVFLHGLGKYLLCNSYSKIKNRIKNKESSNQHNDIDLIITKQINNQIFSSVLENKGYTSSRKIGNNSPIKQKINEENSKHITTSHLNTMYNEHFQQAVLDILKNFKEYIDDKRKTQENAEDWEILMKVIDRVFFIMFTIGLFVSIILLGIEAKDIHV